MPRRRFPFAGTVTAAGLHLLAAAVVVAVLAGAVETADAKKTTSSTTTSSLASSFLEPHNAARRAVGVPALRWDEGLAAYAALYAAAQAGGDCALAHSHGRYGENLFRGSGGAGWTPAAVVDAWVRERPLYDRASNSCRGGDHGACGHYTQVVWRGTTAVGCAMAPCASGRATFAVCSYSPPGNYVGMTPY